MPYWLKSFLEELRGLATRRRRAKLAPMRAYVACVGLIVLAGCFALVIAPDEATMPSPFSSGPPTIVIDAGHGGNDEGAKWRGVLEKTLTLDIAFRVERVLNERGYRTVLTRTNDHYVALSERVAVANALSGPALFISVHFNQGSSGSINGIETFYADTKTPPPSNWTWVGLFSRPEQLDSGENLAADVQLAVVNKTGARNRGIRPRNLYVTRNTRVPAILIEGGFITNRMESQLLSGDEYANRLAEGIADGVETWIQSQPKHPTSILAKQ
ncbi:MAG: N-acetylmuramoyl-L-alanine amidase [Verrucomicrobiota bacterium]